MRIARFFHWWRGQLAQVLPPSLRAGRQRARATLLVDETADGVVLRLRQRGQLRELGPLEDAARNLPGAVRDGRTRVVVRPLAKGVLVREVELPAAAAAAPRHALELNMDTYTPFRPDEVCFGFATLPRKSSQANLAVRLAVVPRERMERMLAPLAALRLEATGELAIGEGGGAVGLVFEPADRSHTSGRLVTGTLVALNLALAMVLVVVPWQRQSAELETLEAQFASARKEAEAVSLVERSLETQRARLDFLATEMGRRPSMAVLLEELSRLLPDDSWLIALLVKRDTVRMQGFSSRASHLIAALQNSSLLVQARFGSPVVSDPRTGAERFDIQANLVQPADEDATAMRTVANSEGVQ